MSERVSDPADADGETGLQPDVSTQEPAAPAAAPAPSAGQLLRRAREAQGLHIAALAVALKVPVRKLEALEGDRHDELPDVVFTRALAASVCRSLKVDPAPIMAALPGTTKPRLGQAQGAINAPFRSPRDGPPPSLVDQVSRPVVLVVLALLLGALVLVLLPTTREKGAGGQVAASAVQPASPAAADPYAANSAAPGGAAGPAAGAAAASPAGTTAATADPASPAGAPSPAASPVAAPTAAAATGAQTDARTTVAVSVVASTPTVPSPTLVITPMMSSAVPADGLLVLKATGASWVEVTDARGQVPLRRVLESGEQVAINGPPPLSVIVGRADQTTVHVRGKRFDISGLARENVARFEVK